MTHGIHDVTAEAERIAAERGWYDDAPPPDGPEDYGLPAEQDSSGQQQGEAKQDRKARDAPSVQWPQPLDLADLAQHEPDPPAFVVPDWMPAGYATLLAGHGGVGKSYIALQLAVCIAAGRPWWGLDTERRRVVYLSCEDRENVLHWRLKRICEYMGVNMADLAGWLDIHDLVGRETILWQPAGGDDTPLTASYDAAKRCIRQDDVIFVDGISDTFGGGENDRAQVKAFVNSLLALISADKGAVVLIGHVNKPTASAAATSEGYSGSTQWHNAARARCYLRSEIEQDPEGGAPEATGNLLLELQKSNLGRSDQQIRFSWDDQAKLFTAVDSGSGDHWLDRHQRERKADHTFLTLLDKRENEGRPVSHNPRAGNYAPKAFAKRPDRDGFQKRDFEQAMERLFDAEELEVVTYKAYDRKMYSKIAPSAGASDESAGGPAGGAGGHV